MLVKFKCKEFKSKIRQTVSVTGKVRLESFLESVEQLRITNMEFATVRRDEKGFDNLNRLVITDAEDVEMANFPVLNKLERLQITRCITSNLDFLAQMPNINYVEINGRNIDNINQVGKTPLVTKRYTFLMFNRL